MLTLNRDWNEVKRMTTHLSDWPVEELPCVRADMSLLLIMVGQFCPGYSSSIFSQATPYISISISSLAQAPSANLLQTFSQTIERGRAEMRNCRALSTAFFRFPKGVRMQIQGENMPGDDVAVKIPVS